MTRATGMNKVQALLRSAALALFAFASSAALSFVTPPTLDTTPPLITSAPQVIYQSNQSATIRWVTNKIADSSVTFGLAGQAQNQVAAQGLRVAEHLITLNGLASATAYDFSITSTDPSGNTVTASGFGFSTAADPDSTPPAFTTGPATTNIASSSAMLTWSSSEPASAVVAFGTSAGALTQQLASTEFKAGHTLVLTNLQPSTTYYARVTLTDLAGNGASGATLSFTTLQHTGLVIPLVTGFNLLGNGFVTPLDVAAYFGNQDVRVDGITEKVDAVWAWNAFTDPQKWRFYSPQYTLAQNAAYAAANNFELLSTVPPGEGFWVNAYQPFNLPAQSGAPFVWDAAQFTLRPRAWNLLASGAAGMSPAQFDASVGAGTGNFESLWAWESILQKWYFHSPQLEAGVPFTNCEYAAQNGLLDFGGCTAPAPARTLGLGQGFWVYRP